MDSDQIFFQNCQKYLQTIQEGKDEKTIRSAAKSLKKLFAENNKPKIENSNVGNFRVIIILGCNVSYIPIPYEISFFIDSGLFSIAFLYKHLFKYLYGFTDEQILITNICPGFGQTNSDKQMEISPKRTGYYKPNHDIQTTNNTKNNYYRSKNLESFLPLNICFTQVFKSEYMFPINKPSKEIKIFNRETLKSLNVNEETELFIFFLNHGYENQFSTVYYEYQYFLERIIELNSKKNYIFIDCCYSGYFMTAINASVELIKIFPQIEGETNENYSIRLQALAKILSLTDKVQDFSNDNIFNEVSVENEEIKIQIKKDLQDISAAYSQNKLLNFKSQMLRLKNTNIVPDHFAKIKSNSIIFCSSEKCVESFYLPYRYLPISSFNKLSAFGTYFSSIILLFFLNPSKIVQTNKNTFSAFDLLNFIDSQFSKIQSKYSDLIKLSNAQFVSQNDNLQFSLFIQNSYSSKSVFSFCKDLSLPAFLQNNNRSMLPLTYYSKKIPYEFYPDFAISLNHNQLVSFLSKLLGVNPNTNINPNFSVLKSENLKNFKSPISKKRISTLSDYLNSVDEEANNILSENNLLPIFLAKTIEEQIDFDNLTNIAFSNSLDFYSLYSSFQDQIHKFLRPEVSAFFIGSRPNFLKMFQILEQNVINSPKLNSTETPYQIILNNYIPHIVTAVHNVVDNFYVDLMSGFCYFTNNENFYLPNFS